MSEPRDGARLQEPPEPTEPETSETPETPEVTGGDGGRRRPGRLRRWVVRPLFWLLLLLVALVAGLYFFVQSPYAHRRAVALVVARLSDTLQRDVRVGGVEYDFYPLAFELHDLVIPGPEPDDPAVATVPLVRIQFSWAGLKQRILEFEAIDVERPRVYVRFNPDGTSNLPELKRTEGGQSRFEVKIGDVRIQDGTVEIDERKLPLSVSAKAVWGRAVGEEDDRLAVLLTAQEVVTTLPDANPYPFTVTVKGSFEPGLIRLAAGSLRSPDLTARLAGAYRWSEETRALELDVDADGAARLANRLGYLEQPIAGPFAMTGRFEMAGDAWTYRADVTSPRLDFEGLTASAIRAGLTVTPDAGIRLDVEQARYADGSITGLVTVGTGAGEDGEEPAAAAGSPRGMVELDLKLAGLDLAALVADFELPLAGVSGRLGGEADYRFLTSAPLDGSGWADLDLRATQASARGLPLTGRVPLVVEDGVLSTRAARLTAPGQALDVAGSLDLERLAGRFELRLATEDLGALAAVVPVEPEPGQTGPPAWLPTAGRGTAEGMLTIGRERFDLAARLDLRGVATPAFAVDALAGSFQLTPEALSGLRLEATRDGGALLATGRLPLPRDGRPPAGPLDLALDLEEWPLDSLAGLLPVALEGEASGRLDVGGTFDSLNGRADLTATGLAVSGSALGRAEAHVAFAGPVIEVQRVALETPAGLVLARGTLDRAAEALSFTLDAPSLALGAPPLDAVPPDLRGTLSVEAAVGGTFARPEARLAVRGRDLTLAGRPVGEAGATEVLATWDGERLAANGSLLGLVGFDGGGLLTRERADVALDVRSSRLGELVRTAVPNGPPALAGLEGSFLGSLTAVANFAQRSYRAELRLAELTAGYEGHTITNLEPVAVALTADGVRIESLFLGEPATETELFVGGSIGFAGERPIDLQVQSTVSAVWAEPFLADVELDGYVDLIGNVRGTLADPAIDGQAGLRDAKLILPGFPQAFDDIRGTVLFYGTDRIRLDNLTARFGGGDLRASGRVNLPDPGAPLAYRFQISADDVSVRYPEGFLIRGDAELAFIAERGQTRQLTGAVELDRAFYLRDLEVGTLELLRGVFERQRLEVPQTDELLATTELNVAVEGDDALRVRNNLADLEGDIDLVVRGTLARPVVFGEIELARGGTIVFRDNEYEIERGTLTFTNPYRLDPAIDLVARTEVRNYEITLALSGTLENLNPTFTSDADLANLEVLALLTGAPIDESGQLRERDPSDRGPTGAAGFLYGQAASALSERVNTLFGFDRFRIDPLTAEGGDSVSNVRVTVGKRISKDVFVTYSSNPATDEADIFVAEWQVAENVVLVFTRNGDGSYAVNAQWEKRY